jgi:hypothetical protein
MNFDSYFDPPDHPEPPECCGDYMSVYEDGSCKCPTCGATVAPAYEPQLLEPMEEIDESPLLEEEPHCRHGNEWGDCDTCDHLSDIAYDQARERRGR